MRESGTRGARLSLAAPHPSSSALPPRRHPPTLSPQPRLPQEPGLETRWVRPPWPHRALPSGRVLPSGRGGGGGRAAAAFVLRCPAPSRRSGCAPGRAGGGAVSEAGAAPPFSPLPAENIPGVTVRSGCRRFRPSRALLAGLGAAKAESSQLSVLPPSPLRGGGKQLGRRARSFSQEKWEGFVASARREALSGGFARTCELFLLRRAARGSRRPVCCRCAFLTASQSLGTGVWRVLLNLLSGCRTSDGF